MKTAIELYSDFGDLLADCLLRYAVDFRKLSAGNIGVIVAVDEKLFLISQLEDGFPELVRHNAFHYGVAYIRLLCYENILAVKFIGGQSVVGNIAVS